jgi:hypothetical protein
VSVFGLGLEGWVWFDLCIHNIRFQMMRLRICLPRGDLE